MRKIVLWLLFFIHVNTGISFAQISTVAGSDRWDPGLGDDSLAIEARLAEPEMIAISNRGTLLISDRFHFRVREVDTSGIIHTLAGIDTPGYSGDGAAAVEALIGEPNGIAVDKFDNIYVCFPHQNVIRKIDRKGIITTIAGTGKEGFSGDEDLAIKAELNFPATLKFDVWGNLLFIDAGNHRVRSIDTFGIITTLAGNGGDSSSGDNGPAIHASFFASGIAVDHSGNIFLADYLNNHIRKIDTKGIITTIAGTGGIGPSGDGGLATAAELTPYAIEVDGEGNIFVGEAWNHVLRKIDIFGRISTICGDGTSGFEGDGGDPKLARVNLPCDVTLDSRGNLLFADAQNNRVRKIMNAGTPKKPLGSENYRPTNQLRFSIHPNPSSGPINIELTEKNNEEFTLNVYDPSGRLAFEQPRFTTPAVLNLNVVPGIYVVEIQDRTGNIYRDRIFIQ